MMRLLCRWCAPISLSVLLRRNDFARVRRLLSYMVKCTQQGLQLKLFTTVSFVVHKHYIPKTWPKSHAFYQADVNCLEDFHNFTEHDALWSAKEAAIYPYPYPANFLRNAARRAVNTYYILSLDVDYLPPENLPLSFLTMTTELMPANYRTM